MMLSRWQSTIVDAQGNVQPGARLVIYLESDQSRATVYRDRDGTDPYPLGEVEADEWGYAYFYADPDVYRITSAPLAIDWREVVVAGEWLLEAEANAAQSAAQALASAQASTASAAAASGSASDAQGSANDAQASATAASSSAVAASDSANASSNSASEASTSASMALAYRNQTESFRDQASTAADSAAASENKAEQWAEEDEDVPVEPGKYSAKHWAAKAEAFVGGDAYLQKSDNLSDLDDVPTARDNLGLGTAATRDVGTGPDEVPTNDLLSGFILTPENLADVLNSNGVWVTRAIGEEVWLDDSNPAVEIPPTDSPLFRYIKLTAGENGPGDYNEGILINETVSGSAPLVEATAEVNLPDSPFHGQTVRLLNTERRFVRAGKAGVVQDDQMQRITGSLVASGGINGVYLGSGVVGKGALAKANANSNVYGTGGTLPTFSLYFDSGNSPAARTSKTTGGETRPRNIGRTVYMRIL